MKTFRFLNLALLSALLASSAVVYAQDKPQNEKPPRQEEPKEQPKQDEAKPPRQEEMKPAQEQKEQEKDQKQEEKQEQKQSHEQMKQEQNHPEQQAQHARPAGKSAHIPDDKFKSHFGRGHTFVVQRTVIVEGQPRFQYGGYNFVLVDAWPGDWSYSDECYVDFIDGEYFLFDLAHPGIRIALFVVL